MKLIWWLKISTILSILVGMVHLWCAICFSISSFVMCTNNFIHLIVNILYIQLSSSFYLSQDHSWCRVSFLKGTYNFQNCFRWQFVKVCPHESALKNVSSLLPLSFCSLNLSPIKNLKETLPLPCRMYSIVHLSKIIRLSAFKSPLFYPSS